jgi:hypothetical protein
VPVPCSSLLHRHHRDGLLRHVRAAGALPVGSSIGQVVAWLRRHEDGPGPGPSSAVSGPVSCARGAAGVAVVDPQAAHAQRSSALTTSPFFERGRMDAIVASDAAPRSPIVRRRLARPPAEGT